MFSVILGATIGKMREKGKPLLALFETLSEAMMIITSWVIWISPLGVFFLVTAKLLEIGSFAEVVGQLGFYFMTVMLGLFIHGFGKCEPITTSSYYIQLSIYIHISYQINNNNIHFASLSTIMGRDNNIYSMSLRQTENILHILLISLSNHIHMYIYNKLNRIAKQMLQNFKNYLHIFLYYVGTIALIFFLMTRKLPYGYIAQMGQVLATAFGTGSSSATMPITIGCLDRMGIDPRVTRFVIPVGATINMDGTALYEAVAALFIAQLRGINLTFGHIVAVR